ncbi:LexA family protein [Butyricicoccus pullicaecorum]|uniref:LexA family protein n=1 Tax=Butyricicoccus pullicaecorum TaxID=501571 RepID=UPI00399060A5
MVTAGLPILAVENIEGYLPWTEKRLLRVARRGDSMIGAGILDGDRVVVRAQPTADNGEIVVALLGDSATVKRCKDGNRSGSCRKIRPMTPSTNQAQIIGKVSVIRTY